MRAAITEPREQVLDLAEAQPPHAKTESLQCLGKHALRARVGRCHGRTADQRLGEGQRVSEVAQSRSNSLIEVLARVRSSTRLTITQQASEGPGEPSGSGLPGNAPGITTE